MFDLRNMLCVVAAAAVCLFSSVVTAEDPPVSFSKDVAPILVKNCAACHSAAEANGGYQVANFNTVLKAGDSEAAGGHAGQGR